MSIFFIEGIPGAGKSHESVLRHILPALVAGRTVITNVKGLKIDAIKAHTGLTTIPLVYVDIDSDVQESVNDYLEKSAAANRPPSQQAMTTIAATRFQDCIFEVLVNDALLVLDEVQNYLGDTSGALPVPVVRFFAEHRHQGLDIVMMGQNHKDVHSLIRHRIETLTRLNKLTALGSTKRYAWNVYSLGGVRPTKIRGGVETYDKRIFELYSSHDEGTKNKTHYSDERNSIFNSPMFKFGLPFVLILSPLCFYWLYQIAFGSNSIAAQAQKNHDAISRHASAVPAVSSVPASSVSPVSAVRAPAGLVTAPITTVSGVSSVPASSVVPAPPPIQKPAFTYVTYSPLKTSSNPVADFYDSLFQQFRARYSAVALSSDGKRVFGYLDLVKDDIIVERVKFSDLLKAGYRIKLDGVGSSSLIRLTSPNDKAFLVTSYPIDTKTTGDGSKLREERGKL